MVRGRSGGTPSRPPGLDPAATSRRGRSGPSLGPGRSRAPFVRRLECPVEHKGVDTTVRDGWSGRNDRPACSTPGRSRVDGFGPVEPSRPSHAVSRVRCRVRAPESVVPTPGRTARAQRGRGTVQACRYPGRTPSHAGHWPREGSYPAGRRTHHSAHTPWIGARERRHPSVGRRQRGAGTIGDVRRPAGAPSVITS